MARDEGAGAGSILLAFISRRGERRRGRAVVRARQRTRDAGST